MSDIRQYPTPDQLELPELDEISPDQSVYISWIAQHNRIFLSFVASFVLNIILALSLVTQASKFKPYIQYVTLEGGYPVVWNEHGNPVIDGVEYVPPRLRAVVRNFIEHRYGYDWQNLTKINTALRLMSSEAQAVERQKFLDLNPQETIVATRMRVTLHPDYANWKVVALGNGRFEVEVPGEAHIVDAFRNPDPNNPFVRPFIVKLTVQTVEASDVNPLGYVVIATGRDIL